MKIFCLLSVALLVSCTAGLDTPEGALKNYVNASIGEEVTRDFVKTRVTGKMQELIDGMTDEEFKSFSDLSKYSKNGFKILSKSCQEKTCMLTYTVAYQTGTSAVDFKSEVKKIAELTLVDERWLISDVSNIKTFHEGLEPIKALD